MFLPELSIIKMQVMICILTQTLRMIATRSAFLESSYALAPIDLHQYSHIRFTIHLFGISQNQEQFLIDSHDYL